jgi:hypothetical protein
MLLAACGSPPPPRERPRPVPIRAPAPPPRDPCEPQGGKPPEPLAKTYVGALARARCQAEVTSIMQGIATALGVACSYCHDVADYAKRTPKKDVANWMASELMPRLAKRGVGETQCADCHADDGHGKAKILGEPRSRTRAVEWMTATLVERFDAADGGRLYCKTCHVGQLGDAGFQPRVILTDHLPPLPQITGSAAPSGAVDAGDGAN